MSASSEARRANRLIHETSPYLLQHAYNPVDWRPWGAEAFEAARQLDRPIFLSVGYSACHWCHVMEHESFENPEIARLLNEHFISIKVDREERPDVDQIYMTAVQLMTQRGGWPMSVFLTADGRPFFGGTYWPPTSRMGLPGFRDILARLNQIWTTQRDEVLAAGERLTAAVARVSQQSYPDGELSLDVLRQARDELLGSLDRVYGGFGGAPKFPHPMDVRLLLRCWRRFGDEQAWQGARLTLDRMAGGGMYDHLGGGFHRYSTDARWLVPHFEKMLYDNALLTPAYLEAWQIEHQLRGVAAADSNDVRVVRETLDYVLREMTSPEGGFYSTQDADSEGEEGRFYVWSEQEIQTALDPEAARLFCYVYDVTPGGNWERVNILNRPKTLEQAARVLNIDAEDLAASLARSRATLYDLRSRRVAPGRDDKVLVSWNGLMISALALAGRVLAEPRYVSAAASAATFLLSQVRDESGRLRHSYKDGRARFSACLDDYAALIDAFVELHQATDDARWLESGVQLAEEMAAHFSDPAGGFYYTADDHERLITRVKDQQDNATPSGNSLAATALLRLGRLTARGDLEEAGYRTLQSMSGLLSEHPRAAAQALLALDFHLGPSFEVAIVDGPDRAVADEFRARLATRFAPHVISVRRPAGAEEANLPTVLQPLFAQRPATGSTQFFICERGACRRPVTTVTDALDALFDSAAPPGS